MRSRASYPARSRAHKARVTAPEALERRTHLDSTVVFNEVMYHPPQNEQALEWVELHNQMAVDMDLSGWSIGGGTSFDFPEGTIIRGGGYLVVASSPADLQAQTGYAAALGPLVGRLDNAGERLNLRNNNGRLMDRLEYNDAGDWPVAPDGGGVSLAKINRDGATASAANWAASTQRNGTPGVVNFASAPAAPVFSFNEISPGGPGFFAEIVNGSASPQSTGGYVVVREGLTRDEYRLAPATVAPGAHLVIDAATLGFTPAAGEKLFLQPSDGASVLDAVRVRDELRGRYPEARGRWLRPNASTPGAANTFAFRDEVVINEIMYHHRPLQSQPARVEETALVPIDGLWKYNQDGADLGAAWREEAYPDGGWASGRGLLYVEEGPLPAAKNTPLTLGRNTYYFRNAFNFSGPTEGLELKLRLVVDDGAVVYLNGREVARFSMDDGPVNYDTPARGGGPADAVWSGVYSIPVSELRQGRNVLAMEVHQALPNSSDIVAGAELTATRVISPALPFRDSPESWVELFNRSDHPVDLTGWRLDDAVQYAFPAGTVLGAGEYLVVAKDADHLRGLYPTGVRILGNFEGNLSHGGENVALLDPMRNPADEVHYYDAGRWPGGADGGGSSLELRDPHADNSRAEAWAASDETSKAGWRTYAYRGVAQTVVGPTFWNEFVLGLLEAGEALIDDVSVVELPGTPSARQLIQNGSFTGGVTGWRIIGNHRHSGIVPDPSDPSNQVLRLVATGPTEHMHNHAETTLAGNTPIVDGREYEISFKAKWLGGSNRLNTRLYFNRLVRTTLLDVASLNGTPGARNSRYQANAGPTFADLRHGPVTPTAAQEVTVSVRADDPQGVASAVLKYSLNGAAWVSVPMSRQADGRYAGTVPARPAASIVQFYVEATDGAGAAAMFPAGGPNSRALYEVNDGTALSPRMHDLRMIMTAADQNFMHLNTNVMSDDRMDATVVYDETQVFYDVGVRLKSSQRGRLNDQRVGFNVEFDPDHLFRGVHDSISLDRSGGWSGLGGRQDEIVLWHAINHAGGVPGMYDDLVNVIAPKSVHNGPALLMMAGYRDEYLDTEFENGGDGALHKVELVYYPTTTVTGTAEGLKIPQPDEVWGADIQDFGDDEEQYRWTLMAENNRARDDFSAVMTLGKTLSLTGAALDAASQRVMDVDQWMRVFAAQSLAGVSDVYGRGLSHNLMLYQRPEDGKMLALPWDWDFAWHQGVNSGLFPGSNVGKVVAMPANRRLSYGHLKDMIDTTFNASYMSAWTTHYATLAGQNYAGVLDYITQRSNYVRAQLPAPVPFQVTTNGGADFSTDQDSVLITGDGWIDVRRIVIEGRTAPLDVIWTDENSWQVVVPLAFGANALNFQAFDRRGNLVGADAITVTTSAERPVFADGLRVTEVMYHPADPPAGSRWDDEDFEFIELKNVGTVPLPLGGVRLFGGAELTLPAFTLAPGGYGVLVSNREAFQSRYGTDVQVIGQYGGSLDNAGEPLTLEGPAGEAIAAFTYDDAWYASTDGPGRSLTVRDPLADPATLGDPTAWRPSNLIGGSPGAADPAVVVGRHVFYNNSAFDGRNAAANSADDNAIAADKEALLPGQTATFANYTSYSRGINGVMIDVAGIAGTLSPGDFLFRTGRGADPSAWPALSQQPAITVRPGAGAGGTDRITLVWPDGAVRNTWLQVTLLPTAVTGLPSADVFYFGNLVGETGNSTTAAAVTPVDLGRVRAAMTPLPGVPLTSAYDFNRDGRVNVVDLSLARVALRAPPISVLVPPPPPTSIAQDGEDGLWAELLT